MLAGRAKGSGAAAAEAADGAMRPPIPPPLLLLLLLLLVFILLEGVEADDPIFHIFVALRPIQRQLLLLINIYCKMSNILFVFCVLLVLVSVFVLEKSRKRVEQS